MNRNNKSGIQSGLGIGHDGRNGDRHKGQRKRSFPPETWRVRMLEYRRRGAAAQGRAEIELRHRYPDDWAEIYARHRAAVWAERGPLPGDEPGGEA